ncbi:MAG: cytochrome c oxidase subunit II [Candidatus Acidiferrales bacterium]
MILLVAATLCVFAAHLFPAPPPITSAAIRVDHQYDLTLYAAGGAFVLAQLGLAFMVFRYRDRGQRAHFTRGHTWMEITWTVVTLATFLGLGIAGNRVWADLEISPSSANPIQVEVTESQFVYTFRYPGPDRKFGRLEASLISPATGNPLGLDPNDAAGKDDIITSSLTVPVNRPIELLIRSQDVIHNFFVRELRLQQDAVPGMVIPMHFTPERIGQYEIVCTQLCGLGHYHMHSMLNVVSADDYASFLKQQAAAQ